MILDGHIHMRHGENDAAEMKNCMSRCGVSGGLIISPSPTSEGAKPGLAAARERIKAVMGFCADDDRLFPCYWVDAVASDAEAQVEAAAEAGVVAFKVICTSHYPSDAKAMRTYRRIAALAKQPLLFHSGISWDGRNSSNHNRPGEFECMLDVPGLKFTLAHVSWPWCDECIAVFGKFMHAYSVREDLSTEMFIDITPGTPVRWRREVFEKLFLGDYDVTHNVIFGTDCSANDYNAVWTNDWINRDNALYSEFGIGTDDFKDHIYHKNLLRFLGKSDEVFDKKIPKVGG